MRLSITRYTMLLLFGLVLSIFYSCENTGPAKKQRSIGNTSEILVVVQNEEQWDGRIGEVIQLYLGAQQYGLNQAEPIFKLSHITTGSFSDLFQKHRNLIFVNIDEKSEKASIESSTDRWAIPQQIFNITAKNSDEFVEVFEKNVTTIRRRFDQIERERIISIFKATSVNKTTEKINEVTGLRMIVPMDFVVAKSEPGFLWIRKEATDYSQGFVILYEPYQDTAQFSKASILSRTKLFLNRYVPGPSDNSYMTIDEFALDPQAIIINDFLVAYAIEIRGLWKVENDFMGGPFVSYTFVNPNNNQLITMYGYVYKPNKEKRDLLRQVESILYSVSL